MSSTVSDNSEGKPQHNDVSESGREMKKRKHQLPREDAGEDPDGRNSLTERRYSTEKATRDPRDEADSPSPRKALRPDGEETKSVIDFDGLSRPGTSFCSPSRSCRHGLIFFKALAPG